MTIERAPDIHPSGVRLLQDQQQGIRLRERRAHFGSISEVTRNCCCQIEGLSLATISCLLLLSIWFDDKDNHPKLA